MGLGVTLQQLQGWQGQLATVERWHQRVVEAANGNPSADEFDFLLTFFEHANRLRDWLVETKAVSDSAVDRFIASHVELRICRDISNGFKHHRISRRPSIDAEFSVVNQYVDPEPNGRKHRLPNGEWTVLANGEQFGLVDLSERIIALWRSFVAQQGLVYRKRE